LQQGRIAEAETSARRLWGTAKLESALADLKESNSDAGASEDASWGDLFSRRYRKVVGVGMSLFLFQQFAGINAVVYFSTNVFRSAGIASDVAASALVGAANVIGTILHPHFSFLLVLWSTNFLLMSWASELNS
jgi:hypothetical protein